MLDGAPIQLQLRSRLTANRGLLYSDQSRGQPVHAGTFLRQRIIVVDAELLRQRAEFGRILTHELFHFVWVRLGNPKRQQWQVVIERELRLHARGELGWSAEWRKETGRRSGRPWREYLCESFCDTAAWFFAGDSQAGSAQEEFTLAPRFREGRGGWMSTMLDRGPLSI